MNEAYVAVTQANCSQWKQASSHSLIARAKIEHEARHVTFPPLEVRSDIHPLAGRARQQVQEWTSELTRRLGRRLHVGVDGLEQVVVIKIQDKFFKVFKRFPVRGRAVALVRMLLRCADASRNAGSALRTMVVGAAFLVGAPLLWLVLSPNVCHLHRRRVLLSSSLQADALLIQSFPLRNAVARPGLHGSDLRSARTASLPLFYFSLVVQKSQQRTVSIGNWI